MSSSHFLPSSPHLTPEEQSPSSPSSSASDFGSTESRSTTPSSEFSAASLAKAPTITTFPSIYVAVPHAVRPQDLDAVHREFAGSEALGFYLNTTSPTSATNQLPHRFGSLTLSWSQTRLLVDGQPIGIYVSKQTSTEPTAVTNVELVTCMTSGYASHLDTISVAALRSVISFSIPEADHILHFLERPSFVFKPLSKTSPFTVNPSPTTVAKGNVPTLEEWRSVWSAWDLITLGMIPHEMLHQKPIDLRHKCLFYIGHIPTFLDMLLSKSIGGGASEPKYFWNIFERGIDPHVDDPDHCHNHSEVPEKDEDWPDLETIMAFRIRVRARLVKLYHELESGTRTLTRNIARTLVMTLEHEGFHIETLLYMLIQRVGTGTLPPPGFASPAWPLFIAQWDTIPSPDSSTVTLGPADIVLGHQDSEADDTHPDLIEDVDGHTFGWDNESPPRCVHVGKFRADWRPISNWEFERFYHSEGKGKVNIPKSWVEENGEFKVRTMYGPVAMAVAQHWPVLTSYDDLQTYASFKGGRLPTEPELRLFLDTYDVGHEGGANVGFRNWHPVPATTGLDINGGRGSNGGVWEWTSTLFDTHEGLAPTNIFTGYSTDFFDTKHQVVLGASYATIPRLAGRRTVRNFWQHNYPYPWVGARVVYDS